jgi:RHS repeat-associated protein
MIPVPGGFVDAVGGNLMLRGVGISIDTPLGTQRVEATWNAAPGAWQWSHLVRYDGATFVEASGARIDAGAVPDGAPIPGTGWTRVDARTLRTRGGLAWHFGADGRLDHLRWIGLEYPRIAFAEAEIAQCTAASACAPIFTLTLHASGQPESVTDARSGRVARFEYDADGRLVVARSAEDVAQGRPGTRYEYDGARLVAATSSEGERVAYAYQAGGRIRRVSALGESGPSHVFDFYGSNFQGQHRTSYENPLGGHLVVYFDESRRVTRVERFENGESRLFEWEGLRPTRIEEPDGSALQIAWQQERIAALVTPAGNVVTTTYASPGLSLDDPLADPILRAEDSLGLVEARSYDAQGRPVSIEDGAGGTRVLAWNAASLASLETDGIAVDYTLYGAHGHWLDAVVAGGTLLRRGVDRVGNETLPPAGRRVGGLQGYRFDADRRIAALDVSASDETGRVVATERIHVTRRGDGALARIERPGGGDHELVRDAHGRLVGIREYADGAWRETRFELDAMGNATARELANGMREEWQRDVYGRVVAHRALRDGVLEGEEAFVWRAGRVVARTDSLRGTGELYAFDAAGRTAQIAFGHGESISYEYDARDRLVGEVYSVPGAGVVADVGYAYDGANRRVAIQDRASGQPLVAWSFEGGRLGAIDTGNGLRRSFAYDAEGRVVSMETRDPAGALAESSAVSRAVAADPPRYEVRSETATALAQTEEHYWLPQGASLSNPDQRVGKRIFGWSDGSGTVRRYAWDGLGNRADTAQGDAFVYDAARTRLLSASSAQGEIEYAYDAAGFAISRGGVPLEWTATGRLARMGWDRIEWDMAGRPISVRRSGVTREFLLFGGRIESSATTLGALDLGDVVLDLAGVGRRWRHFDFRGQVSFVTDETGAAVAHFRYQPFGVDAGFGPEADAARFENREAFGELFLLGARVLDPAVGRFLSPDPWIQAVDQYGYALGNPVDFEDADGLQTSERVELERMANAIENSAKVALALILVASGGTLGPEATIGFGVAIGVAAGIRLYLIATETPVPNPPSSVGSESESSGGSGSVTIIDLAPGSASAGAGAATGSTPIGATASGGGAGCSPMALANGQGDARRLLLGLLLVNALVAAAWWGFERRRGSTCSRN